jgi:DUF218 domain
MPVQCAEQLLGTHPLDVIYVLGRGNSLVDGVSAISRANASFAGQLSLQSLRHEGLLIASGLGPEDLPYSVAEAEAMAQVAATVNPHANIVAETHSTNTFENIVYGSGIIDFPVERVGIVATRGHAERGAYIAGRWFSPAVEIVAIPTLTPVSVAGRALERVLLALSANALKDVEPGDREGFMAASALYQRRIAAVKQSPLKKMHSGRR